jgi:hypothetical protein
MTENGMIGAIATPDAGSGVCVGRQRNKKRRPEN